MKNYLNYENRFRTTNKKIIPAIRSTFAFRLYWRSLGHDPKYVWEVLHQKNKVIN